MWEMWLLLLAVAAVEVGSTSLEPVRAVCPIGGEVYTSFRVMGTYQSGIQLDMRPLGPISSIPYDECPGNGFIVYQPADWFDEHQLATLAEVVASPAYQQMRTDHVDAYRVVTLRSAVGAWELELHNDLLRAVWEGQDRGDAELSRRYRAEARAALLAKARSAQYNHNERGRNTWWNCMIVAAELQRQDGDFTGALASLQDLQSLLTDQTVVEADIVVYRRRAMDQIRHLAQQQQAQPAVLGGGLVAPPSEEDILHQKAQKASWRDALGEQRDALGELFRELGSMMNSLNTLLLDSLLNVTLSE